jgi:hypothetical protein
MLACSSVSQRKKTKLFPWLFHGILAPVLEKKKEKKKFEFNQPSNS